METDLYALQKDIKDYITENYQPIVKKIFNLEPLEKSIMGYPDIDRERKNKILYFDFDEYAFEVLSLDSYSLNGILDIYITLKGSGEKEKMSEEISKYATCFFNLVNKNKTLDGRVDEMNIEKINFYEHAEGNANFKAAKIKVKFVKEYY